MNAQTSLTRTKFVEFASHYVGYPSILYVSPEKGMSESGFDCSGFIRFLLDRLRLPVDPRIRHCTDFFNEFGIIIHEETAGIGDLLFYSRDGIRPTHIAIMRNADEVIHAPGTTSSKVEITRIGHGPINWNGKAERIYFQNPIGYKRIAIQNGRYRYPLPL